MTPDCQVIHGSCLDVLPSLAGVDCIVADPPYGTGEYVRFEAGQGKKWGTKHHKAEWDEWSTAWLEIAVSISACCAVFCPETMVDDLIRFAKEHRKPFRLFAWCKPDPLPLWSGHPGFGIDPIVVIGEPQKVRGRNWFEASTPRKGQPGWMDHPHQKPAALMRWLIPLVCPPGGIVVDPFAGSGTTGAACLKTGRRCVLIEREAKYIPLIMKQTKDAETPLFQGL